MVRTTRYHDMKSWKEIPGIDSTVIELLKTQIIRIRAVWPSGVRIWNGLAGSGGVWPARSGLEGAGACLGWGGGAEGLKSAQARRPGAEPPHPRQAEAPGIPRRAQPNGGRAGQKAEEPAGAKAKRPRSLDLPDFGGSDCFSRRIWKNFRGSNLSTCGSSLSTCGSNLSTCGSSLSTCGSSLSEFEHLRIEFEHLRIEFEHLDRV